MSLYEEKYKEAENCSLAHLLIWHGKNHTLKSTFGKWMSIWVSELCGEERQMASGIRERGKCIIFSCPCDSHFCTFQISVRLFQTKNQGNFWSMETLKFALLKLSIFLPHQTFHITTPLEWDFGSVKGLVNWWNDSWCFRSCDIVIEKDKGISSAVVINKLQSQNPTPVRHPIALKHNKFWN